MVMQGSLSAVQNTQASGRCIWQDGRQNHQIETSNSRRKKHKGFELMLDNVSHLGCELATSHYSLDREASAYIWNCHAVFSCIKAIPTNLIRAENAGSSQEHIFLGKRESRNVIHGGSASFAGNVLLPVAADFLQYELGEQPLGGHFVHRGGSLRTGLSLLHATLDLD